MRILIRLNIVSLLLYPGMQSKRKAQGEENGLSLVLHPLFSSASPKLPPALSLLLPPRLISDSEALQLTPTHSVFLHCNFSQEPLCKYTMFLCKTQLQKKPRTPNLQKLEIFRAHMDIPGLCRKAISGSIPAAPERFCGCLLNVMTQTPKEELCKLANCIERADEKLGYVVRLLVEKQDSSEKFKNEASQLFNSIGSDVKKAYCNCLIDLCVNLNLLERACELLDLGITLGIYIGLQSRSQTQWSLYLKGLSLGAALTALHVWINDLSRVLESGEELPPVLGINTGHGKHKHSDKGLASVIESHLKELNAPFHESQIMAHKL